MGEWDVLQAACELRLLELESPPETCCVNFAVKAFLPMHDIVQPAGMSHGKGWRPLFLQCWVRLSWVCLCCLKAGMLQGKRRWQPGKLHLKRWPPCSECWVRSCCVKAGTLNAGSARAV